MIVPVAKRVSQIFMTHARHVHQLSYAAGQITVQVYMRQKFFKRSAVDTTFIHWPKLGSRFFKETCTLICRYVQLSSEAKA